MNNNTFYLMKSSSMGAPKGVLDVVRLGVQSITKDRHINPLRAVVLGKLLDTLDELVDVLLRALVRTVQSKDKWNREHRHHAFAQVGDVLVEQDVVGDAQLLVVQSQNGRAHQCHFNNISLDLVFSTNNNLST
jgi:hypothetical protein